MLRFRFLLHLLLLPSAAFSQTLTGDSTASSESINTPGTVSARPYREVSFYAAQSFGYPKIMSDLKDQRMFVLGGRFTGHLYRFPHLNLNGNVDLKPLAVYSNDVHGPRQYTYGGAVEIGLQIDHVHQSYSNRGRSTRQPLH